MVFLIANVSYVYVYINVDFVEHLNRTTCLKKGYTSNLVQINFALLTRGKYEGKYNNNTFLYIRWI